jgi:hypothetical protein
MAIAKTLINYLRERGVDYQLLEHSHTYTARASARSAHLPAHQIAKRIRQATSSPSCPPIIRWNSNG